MWYSTLGESLPSPPPPPWRCPPLPQSQQLPAEGSGLWLGLLWMAITGKETLRVTSMLSVRFKYVIGIGVGAGAYVLAKFAVSLPTTTPRPS